jgi:hypothetical protein
MVRIRGEWTDRVYPAWYADRFEERLIFRTRYLRFTATTTLFVQFMRAAICAIVMSVEQRKATIF